MSPSPPYSPSSSIPTAVSLTVRAADDQPSSAVVSLATIASLSPITALPAPNPNPNPSSTKRGLPPPCWSNEETLALIDSYREKWYSLRRGNLRAAHWDEVAAAVARLSLHLPGATPKTSVQCRHKIEKLRKRYRSERQRSLAHDPTSPPSSPWIFFKKMDLMENPNPTPIPNPNPNPNPNSSHLNNHYHRYQESDDDDDDNDEEMEPMFHRRPQVIANGSGGGGSGGSLKFKIPKAVRTSRVVPMGSPNPTSYSPNPSIFSKGFVKPGLDEMRRRLESKRRREEEEEEEKGSGAMGGMVRALRMLGDGYMKMELMKMDMAREMERARMEMELKKTEMILDTQRRITDSFVKGVVGEKKAKRSLDS